MDVSANVNASIAPIEAMKKSMDVQERATLKILESASEQSKQVNAQKTGLGNHINISG